LLYQLVAHNSRGLSENAQIPFLVRFTPMPETPQHGLKPEPIDHCQCLRIGVNTFHHQTVTKVSKVLARW
jgi:hypothetical protein